MRGSTAKSLESGVIVGGLVALAFMLGHSVGDRAGFRRGIDAAIDAFDCMTDRERGRFQPPHTKARCDALGVPANSQEPK